MLDPVTFRYPQVSVPGLNDSKMIGMAIYNVVVLSVLGVTVSLALRLNIDLTYLLSSGTLVLATTVTQCLIMVPKVTRRGDTRPPPPLDRHSRYTLTLTVTQCLIMVPKVTRRGDTRLPPPLDRHSRYNSICNPALNSYPSPKSDTDLKTNHNLKPHSIHNCKSIVSLSW